jgi:EC042_2821-lke REase
VVPKDPSTTHPYRRTELLKALNAALAGKVTVTAHDIQCLVVNHDIKKRSEFFYQGRVPGSPGQYSTQLVDWVVQHYERDPEFFTSERRQAKGKDQRVVPDVSRAREKHIAEVQQSGVETLAELAHLTRNRQDTVDTSV